MKCDFANVLRPCGVLLAACLLGLMQPAALPAEMVPNADFDEGDASPQKWALSGGEGRWVDRQILEVTGGGDDSNFWRCDACRFEPGGLYHFEMRARRTSGSGGAMAGPAFANRDYSGLGKDWRWYGHVFSAPQTADGSYLRLGQWHTKGALQFDAVRLGPTIPVHKSIGGLLLGEGESIRDGQYRFEGSFDHQGSNYHRTLQSATASFNSTRWTFGGGSQVTYCFALPGHKLLSGEAGFNIGHYLRGGCKAEISRNQKDWHPLAARSSLGVARAALPEAVLPAEELFLRLGTTAADSSLQIYGVEFEAKLSGTPPAGDGRTVFADVESGNYRSVIEAVALEDGGESGRSRLRLVAKNPGRKAARATLSAAATLAGRGSVPLEPQTCEIVAGGSATFELELPSRQPGLHEVELVLSVPGVAPVKTTLQYTVPDYHRTDYGRQIAGVSGQTAVWWCDATHKIPPQRAVPQSNSPAAELSAARGDFEAVQVVVRPSAALRGLSASAGALSGPGGATIAAENIRVLRVYYHHVHRPTDATGIRGRWPDALPPLSRPIDVPAGENQPLWVLIRVPDDAAAGDYRGKLSLAGDGFSASVPIRLHVWDFTLPKRNHLKTAFGFGVRNVFRYQQLKTDAQRRRVLDMYLENFAEHRISPYDPVPLDPIGVKFEPQADPPRAELDFSSFDRAMSQAVEKYHFNNYRLPIQGMGGGSFHARHEPKIGNYGEDTPQYQAMFSSYVKQLEGHLRQRGWLDMAFIYWFDEPAPKDYEFVRGGMQRLKRYAPGLQTMLTEQVEEKLAGAIDIWCPVSPNYDHPAAEKRRAHGERFWWYVCCGPKAPFCTLFIDHPASELRVWLWQTWERNILGILVWQSNYWTSSAAYPKEPQNPYEDPMGYVSGYSTPAGTKRYWGNGDGRFIYPPLAAATPGASGAKPVLAPPVSSIRWEMLREGIEDYEYLYMLRELLAKRRGSLSPQRVRQIEALLEVPDSITKDMTTFTTDPAPIYARRAAIAEAIEQLAK